MYVEAEKLETARKRRSPMWRWTPAMLLLAIVAFSLVRSASAPLPHEWGRDFDASLAEAASTRKPLLVAFHMKACPPCILMKKRTLPHRDVRAALASFVPVEVDVDRAPEVAARFGVMSTPTYAVVDPDGRVLAGTEGYHAPEQFVQFLHFALKAEVSSTSAPTD